MLTPRFPRLWTGALALALLAPLAACGDADDPADTDVPVVVDTDAPDADLIDDDLADADAPEAPVADAEDPGYDEIPDHSYDDTPGHPSLDTPPTMLLGTWESTQDPDAVVEFYDGMHRSLYAGEDFGASPYTISEGCNGGTAPVFAFTVTTDGEAVCYTVVTLTDVRLEYSMAGGRGNTLTFERVPESAT